MTSTRKNTHNKNSINPILEGFIISFLLILPSFFITDNNFYYVGNKYLRIYLSISLAFIFFLLYFLVGLIRKIQFKLLFSTFVCLLLILFSIFFLTLFREIKGNSMYPNFKNGQLVSCYPPFFIKNNNVVIFERNGKEYIKRVIGIPKDVILFDNNLVYRNGALLNEGYSANQWENGFTEEGKKYTVPNKSYFVLGDNRLHSSDSREFGFISKSDIECVVYIK